MVFKDLLANIANDNKLSTPYLDSAIAVCLLSDCITRCKFETNRYCFMFGGSKEDVNVGKSTS